MVIENKPDDLKIRGLRKLVNCLIVLINKTYVLAKDEKEKKDVLEYKEELEKIKKIIPQLYKTIINQIKRTKQLKIDNIKYDPILKRVLEIKILINEFLNKNNLVTLRKTTSIKINPEIWKRVKKHCSNKEIDISDWLEKLIEKELKK